MKIKNQLTLQRLVGKIDNDFNISESDWIPRVAAWTIDALSQMKVLPMQRKERILEVSDKIAQFPCEINGTELKVFDKYCVEIPQLVKEKSCCNEKLVPNDIRNRRNFVLDGNNIELNFNTDIIKVETYEVATYYDEYYDCECPYIYDNGLLLEALAWYCMFKYLSRGSTHPVYSLKSPNQATNPYMQWMYLKPKAAASVKIDINKSEGGWNNFFYNSTFLPRG